jgi:hypothetical protein
MYNVANRPITKAHKAIERAPTKERTTASVSEGMRLAYERFLEMPVPVVLVVMWVSGVALLGACTLLAYAVISALVGTVAGAF